MTGNENHVASARRYRLADRTEWVGVRTAATGLLGLFAGWLIRRWLGNSEQEQVAGALGSSLMWLFSGAFVLGLMVVLPASSLLRRRARRLAPISDDTDQVEVPEWELPARIGWPLWAITTVGSLWLIYMLVAFGIPLFFERGKL
jgi:hypothetical protein